MDEIHLGKEKIMAQPKRKLTQQEVARFKAIQAKRKAAANDNQGNPKCAYVDTTMTPGMLEACVAAAGFEG